MGRGDILSKDHGATLKGRRLVEAFLGRMDRRPVACYVCLTFHSQGFEFEFSKLNPWLQRTDGKDDGRHIHVGVNPTRPGLMKQKPEVANSVLARR